MSGGSYNVRVKLISTGCVSAAAVKAITDAPAAVTNPISTVTNATSCNPSNGIITFTSPTPTTNYEFSIDGGVSYDTSHIFTNLSGGSYSTRARSIVTGCESNVVAKTIANPTVTAANATLTNNTSCSTSPNGVITISAPTPKSNYEFSIDGGLTFSTDTVFTGLNGGTYPLVARLISTGCTSNPVNKNLTNAPAAIAAPVSTVTNVTDCNTPNGSINITSPTPLTNYEFSIDGGATYQSSPLFSNLSAGTYTVKARNLALLCTSAVSSKTITNPAVTIPTATTSNPSNCTSPNGSITITAPAPLSNYEFSIDGGLTFQASTLFSNLEGGTYSVVSKLISTGCTSNVVSKTLNNPAVTSPTAAVTNNTSCIVNNGSINITAPTPLANYTFSINGGSSFQTTSTFTGLAANTYSVVIKSLSTGCKSAIVNKTITNAPAAIVAPTVTLVNNTNCNTPNGTITFTAPTPLTNYIFSVDSGATFSSNNIKTGLSGGTYYVRVKSNITGCVSNSATKTLTNLAIAAPAATVVNNTNCSTPNGKITFTAPTPLGLYEFSVDSGMTYQASNEFTNLPAGIYKIRARQISSGCVSSVVSKTITNPTIAAPISTITHNTNCNAPTGKIVFSSPTPLVNYLFSIDSGATYQSNINFLNLPGGVYYTRVKNIASGCESAVANKTINNPAVTVPTVTVVNNTNCFSPNGKLTITAPTPLANYEFSIDSGATFFFYYNLFEYACWYILCAFKTNFYRLYFQFCYKSYCQSNYSNTSPNSCKYSECVSCNISKFIRCSTKSSIQYNIRMAYCKHESYTS
ncbi:MAG: hypothetical protein R2831_10705 [Chitinophagaceae bacterium]